MPTYRVSDKVSGAVLDLTGDAPPTDEDLDKIFFPFQAAARLKKDRSTPPLPVKSVMGSVGEAVMSPINTLAQEAAAIPADVAMIAHGDEKFYDPQNIKAAVMGREMPITQKINEAASESPTAATIANISQGLASVAPYIATGNFPATAQRLMALGFSAQMVYGVKDLATQYGDEMGKPPEQRDQAKVAQLQAALIQTPLFTSLLAVGAKRGGLTGEKRPVTPVARPQAAAPTKTAPAVETPVQPQAAAPPAPLGGFPMADKLKARLDALKAQLPATATKIEPKQATSEPSYSPQDLARWNELTTEQNRLVAENKVGDKNGLTPEWTANQAAKEALKRKYNGGTPEQVAPKSPEVQVSDEAPSDTPNMWIERNPSANSADVVKVYPNLTRPQAAALIAKIRGVKELATPEVKPAQPTAPAQEGVKPYYGTGKVSGRRGGVQYVSESPELASQYAEGGKFGRKGAKVSQFSGSLNVFESSKATPEELNKILGTNNTGYLEPDGNLGFNSYERDPSINQRLKAAGYDAVRISEGENGTSIAVLPHALDKLKPTPPPPAVTTGKVAAKPSAKQDAAFEAAGAASRHAWEADTIKSHQNAIKFHEAARAAGNNAEYHDNFIAMHQKAIRNISKGFTGKEPSTGELRGEEPTPQQGAKGAGEEQFAAGNDLTGGESQRSITEAINEKHEAARPNVSKSPDKGWMDDFRRRAESTFRRISQNARQVFGAAKHDHAYAESEHGQQLQAVARAHGTEVAFFKANFYAPKGFFTEGKIFLRSNLPKEEITRIFEHELIHRQFARSNITPAPRPLANLFGLVDLNSPAAKAFRAEYDTWLQSKGLKPLTDDKCREEIVADFVSGRRSSDGFDNPSRATSLAIEYHSSSPTGAGLKSQEIQFAPGDAEKAIDESGAVRKNGIGIQKFFTDDVLKNLKGISGGVAQLARIAKTDFHNLFAPESASPNARATDALARKYVQTREQIKQAFQKQTENQSKFWDALPEQTKLDFLQGMETGKVPDLGKYTEQAKVLAQQYRDRFDADFKNEKTLGIDINYRANYFPHLWKDATAATKFFKQLRDRMGGDRYSKTREINLISEGLKGGLELIDTNPETLALKRDFDSARIVTQQSFVNHLESIGLAEEVKTGGEYGGSTILESPNGKKYAIPPDVAAVVNNAFFQKSLWENKSIVGTGFRGLMNLKNLFIPVKLGLSLFHPVHIVGIDNAARLANIVEAVKDKNLSFSDAVSLAVKSQGNFFHPKGKQFVDAYNRYGWDKSMPADMQQSIQHMIEGGFNPNREGVWKSKSGEGFRRAVSQGNYPGAAIRGIPAALQMMQKPIFDMWIPRLRAASFDVRARELFRARPELLDDATQRAIELGKIAKEIDNQYGEMNYSTLFWNRYCRDAGVGMSLSMGWNLGFLREFGGGAIDFGKAGVKLAQMKRPEITNKMLFTSIYTAQAMLFGGLATWALTGKPPTQFLDYFYPKTGEKNDDGSDERLSTPYYTREYFMAVSHIQKDGLIGGTAGLIAGKSNPLLSPLIELFKNKDYFGYEIHDPHSPYIEQAEQVAAFLGKSAMPISVASGIEYHASETAKVASYAGFNPAPRYITRTKIQNDISNMYERRYGGEEQKPYSKRLEFEAKQAIKEAKKSGDTEKVQELELEAKHNRILTARQITYMHRANIPADVFMWKRLPESDKQALRSKMTDEEKKRYPFKD